MAHISTLISSALTLIYGGNQEQVEFFVSELPLEDQCALVSAACIGEAHIHHDRFIVAGENAIAYFTKEAPCNRYFHTGNGEPWFIPPETFAALLWRKRASLTEYYAAFERCARNSGVDLADF